MNVGYIMKMTAISSCVTITASPYNDAVLSYTSFSSATSLGFNYMTTSQYQLVDASKMAETLKDPYAKEIRDGCSAGLSYTLPMSTFSSISTLNALSYGVG